MLTKKLCSTHKIVTNILCHTVQYWHVGVATVYNTPIAKKLQKNGSVYFAVIGIIAFRVYFAAAIITPSHTNNTSYSILLSSRTRLSTPSHLNPNQIEAIQTQATKAKQTKSALRIEPKTSTACFIIRCALCTELSRTQGNLTQNGA